MKNRAILTALIFITLQSLYSQKNVKSFLVVSYNVENLFDTINSPLSEDDEFTPSGSKAWTYDRYTKKLNDLLDQEKGLTTGYDSGVILKEEWMLYESEKYGESLPSATYGGPEYFGGPSDHLPIYIFFTW